MQSARFFPRSHMFVCANRRDGSPLGPGCSHFGDEVFATLKRRASSEGRVRDVWVTQTQCMGICPKIGTVVRIVSERGSTLLEEVVAEDVDTLWKAV